MSVPWAYILPQVLTAYQRAAAAHECRLLNVTENATYLVPAKAGEKDALILRLNRPGYRDPQQVVSELAWMTTVRKVGVALVPTVLPDRTGNSICEVEGQQAIAFEFIDGSEPTSDRWAQCFQQLGSITARLHRHARSWVSPPGFTRPVWNLDSLLGDGSPYGTWADNELVKPDQALLLAAAEQKLRHDLAGYGTGPERFGLIHSDLRTANLLVKANGQVYIIDFDDCGYGWYLFDLACALSFIETDAQAPTAIGAWLQGYTAIQPLSRTDVRIMPTMIMMRRLQMTAWMQARQETRFAATLRNQDFVGGTQRIAREYLDDTLFSTTFARAPVAT